MAFFPASAWIDASGNVVSIVSAGSPPQLQIAIGNGGPLSYQVAPGSLSPSGNTLLAVQSSTVNDAGVAVYSALYTGGFPEVGLYVRAVDGTIATRLLRNATAPRGGTITGFTRGTINESAQVATRATVEPGSGAVGSILRIDGPTVHELARQGDLAIDGATTLGAIVSGAVMLNDAGQTAFTADYTQLGVSRRGIFIADSAGLRLATPGILPGAGAAVSNAHVFGISNSGSVGLWAEFLGGGDPISGMYIADAIGPTLVALEDTLVPSGGKYFRSFLTDAVAYNNQGQLAFLAELSDAPNGPAAGRGLFVYDPLNGLDEVAKTGDALMGGTISAGGVYFYNSTGNGSLQAPDTSLSGLNNLGQVGFAFALDKGQGGVAIWSPAEEFATGDFDEDGAVAAADLEAWKQGFGISGDATHTDGDADGDLDVDGADFLVWQRQLSPAAATDAVPEPATSALVGMLTGAWLQSGCRRRASHLGR